MTREPISAELEAADEALHEIESLIEQVARLAQADVPTREFDRELLAAAVRALAAAGGAVWVPNANGWSAECQINLGTVGLADVDADAARQHGRLLHWVAEQPEVKLFAPQSGSSRETFRELPDDEPANPTKFVLVVCPVMFERTTIALVEVMQRPTASLAAQRGSCELLATFGGLAADFHRNRRLRELRGSETLWGQFSQFAQRVHASLDLEATAYALANEGRLLVGCDRVSVLVAKGRTCRLLAMSGVAEFDRRALIVQRLEGLAAAASSSRDPLWYGDTSPPLPPQIEEKLHALIDESHARACAVLPLLAAPAAAAVELSSSAPSANSDAPLGVLVLEHFQGPLAAAQQERAAAVQLHGATALRNALEMDQLPLAGVSRWLGRAKWLIAARQLPKTALVAAALIALIGVLTLVPADFTIEARGGLQPRARRDVFAPSDGVISALHAAHAKQFAAGDVLAVLRDPRLELEFRRVEGETQTALARLRSIEATRVENRQRDSADRERYGELTAEEQEVKELLKGLEAQRAILEQQRAELEVRSPIAGQVLTWNVDELLAARPVTRGQTLLTIADTSGPWVLELRLPDDQAGHVLAAEATVRADGRRLPVTYIMATEPGVTFHGQVEKVSLATETDRDDVPGVSIVVVPDEGPLPELRPGATAIAHIDCGRRALGYVWLHDLFDAIRTWLFF